MIDVRVNTLCYHQNGMGRTVHLDVPMRLVVVERLAALHTPSDQKGRKTLSYKFQFENRNLSTWFATDMLSPYQREWVSILKAQPLLESRPVKVKRPCCAMPHKNTRGTDSAPRLLRPAQVNTIQ